MRVASTRPRLCRVTSQAKGQWPMAQGDPDAVTLSGSQILQGILMAKIENFRQLVAWQKGMELAEKVYRPRHTILPKRRSLHAWHAASESSKFDSGKCLRGLQPPISRRIPITCCDRARIKRRSANASGAVSTPLPDRPSDDCRACVADRGHRSPASRLVAISSRRRRLLFFGFARFAGGTPVGDRPHRNSLSSVPALAFGPWPLA
jgi:hypothetical protein